MSTPGMNNEPKERKPLKDLEVSGDEVQGGKLKSNIQKKADDTASSYQNKIG